MSPLPETLIASAKDRTLVPFIGAGFSAGLGLPTWSEVISLLANDLGWSPEVLNCQGNFYQIAEYYSLEGDLDGFRSRLNTLFHASAIDIRNSNIHNCLLKLGAPLLYTTNWDTWIEEAFNRAGMPYHVVRGLQDIPATSSSEVEIVKFHGDFHGSLKDFVFTESSYFERMDFESALDIKLRSDVLGKSLLFMGYSFSDTNIRLLWHKLGRLIDRLAEPHKCSYPKSYIVSATPNVLQERLFRDKHIEVIHLHDLDPGIALEEFLKQLIHETYA